MKALFHRILVALSPIAIVVSVYCLTEAGASRASTSDAIVTGGTYRNPLQLALLQWYPNNSVTKVTVGNAPVLLAFDGANMWVTNQTDNTVTKVRVNDGYVVGTFATGQEPNGIAYDGANMWVANRSLNSNSIMKIRASNGMVLGTFTNGIDEPEG